MGMEIKRDKRYKHPIKGADIHGKYAYKLYLEILGNSNIGRYIVVVGKEPLTNGKQQVNEINVQLADKIKQYKDYTEKSNLIKPNMINQYYVKYRVREKSILDLMNEPLFVFKQIKQKK